MVMVPGEIIAKDEDIVINEGRKTKIIHVKHVGDRPVQIGSHYHFFEANKHLEFDRPEAFGFHLNIPAGTAVRFEPGEAKDVELVELGGHKVVHGLAGLTQGPINEENKAKAIAKAKEKGFIK